MNDRSFILPRLLSRENVINRLLDVVMNLPLEKAWRVSIEEAKRERSHPANAYYWSCVVTAISEATGYEVDEVHEYLCGTRWGWKDKKVPKTPRNPLGLESVPIRTTTTNERGQRSVLSISEFIEFTEFARRFAFRKLNLVIPDPDPDYASKREAA